MLFFKNSHKHWLFIWLVYTAQISIRGMDDDDDDDMKKYC